MRVRQLSLLIGRALFADLNRLHGVERAKSRVNVEVVMRSGLLSRISDTLGCSWVCRQAAELLVFVERIFSRQRFVLHFGVSCQRFAVAGCFSVPRAASGAGLRTEKACDAADFGAHWPRQGILRLNESEVVLAWTMASASRARSIELADAEMPETQRTKVSAPR